MCVWAEIRISRVHVVSEAYRRILIGYTDVLRLFGVCGGGRERGEGGVG